jgi:hypothetical protein
VEERALLFADTMPSSGPLADESVTYARCLEGCAIRAGAITCGWTVAVIGRG